MDSTFNSCLKDKGSNPAQASHCVTTVGKLFTHTVPSGAGQLNQLTAGIAGTSVVTPGVVYLRWLRTIQRFFLNWFGE